MVLVPCILCFILIHPGPELVPRALVPTVSSPVLSADICTHISRDPQALPPSGELLLSLTLPYRSDATADAVLYPVLSADVAAVDAALVPPYVQSFGCLSIIACVKTIVQIYY